MEPAPTSTSSEDNSDSKKSNGSSQKIEGRRGSATPRALSRSRVALPTLATSYRPHGKDRDTTDIPMEIAARLHGPVSPPSSNQDNPSVQASKQLSFDRDWVTYGLIPSSGPTAARIIAGKVCNEGVPSPTEAFLEQLEPIEDDFIAALLIAADFVVDGCKRTLTENPQCKSAARHLLDWEEIPQTPAETMKGGDFESLRWLVYLCMEAASDVYTLQHPTKEDSTKSKPRC